MSEDQINHPAHYTGRDIKCPHCKGPIECFDVTRTMDFPTGNVLKYLWRSPYKGMALKDLKKARWYLDQIIAEMEEDE